MLCGHIETGPKVLCKSTNQIRNEIKIFLYRTV